MSSKKSNENSNPDGPKTSGVFHPDADPVPISTTTSSPSTTSGPANVVPNTFDGEFRITNRQWNETLLDPNSPERQQLAAVLVKALQELIPGSKIDINDFKNGSVIVNFRITLPNGQVLTPDEVAAKLREAFDAREGKLLDEFEVDRNSVNADSKLLFQR